MSSLGERLGQARGRESRDKASARLGVHPNTLFKYEKGTRSPDADFLRKAADTYGVNLEWLLSEHGPMRGARDVQSHFRRFDLPEPDDPEMASVPMLDIRASAGSGQLVENEEPIGYWSLPRSVLVAHGINPKGARMGMTVGDSMLPTMSDGDPFVFDITDREPREKIFLMRRLGQIVVKRLQVRSDRTMVLVSDNRAYDPEPLPRDEADELEIIGRVGMVLRSI